MATSLTLIATLSSSSSALAPRPAAASLQQGRNLNRSTQRDCSTSPRSRPWRREGNHAAIGSRTCRKQRRHDDEAVCLDQRPPRTLGGRPVRRRSPPSLAGTYVLRACVLPPVCDACDCCAEWHVHQERAGDVGRRGARVPPPVRRLRDARARLLLPRARGGARHGGAPADRVGAVQGRRGARPAGPVREFSHCPAPAKNLLDRVGNVVGLVTGAALTDNPNSAVLPLGDGRVMCLTETTKSSVLIDPDTLETVGRFRYTDRLGGMVQSAHPIVTETEFLTLLPDLVRPGHLVVRMEAGSNERKVIGRVDCRGGPAPGWLHSFAVTENYVVVPEMPLRYSSASLLNSELAPFYAFDWLPASGSYMHVMCKSTGKTVASVEVPPFMVIHFINAYEEEGDDDVPGGRPAAVVVDCCEHYGDPAIIETLVLNRLRSLRGKDVLPNGRSTWSWHEEGSVPSEPFFVARPRATVDDGVVISIVSSDDGDGVTEKENPCKYV